LRRKDEITKYQKWTTTETKKRKSLRRFFGSKLNAAKNQQPQPEHDRKQEGGKGGFIFVSLTTIVCH